MTVCLYLPGVDGGPRRVGFMFKRPEISDNDALDAGGPTPASAGQVLTTDTSQWDRSDPDRMTFDSPCTLTPTMLPNGA
jgi:hypothetical protein